MAHSFAGQSVTRAPRWLLIADDQRQVADAHAQLFERQGWQVLRAANLDDVQRQLAAARPRWALIEQRFADGCGMQLLRLLKDVIPGIRVVVATRFASLAGAVKSMRLGAHDYLSKPVPAARLLHVFDDEQPNPGLTALRARPSTLARMEWEFIAEVMLQCEGNISETARVLGVDRRGLRRKLDRGSP